MPYVSCVVERPLYYMLWGPPTRTVPTAETLATVACFCTCTVPRVLLSFVDFHFFKLRFKLFLSECSMCRGRVPGHWGIGSLFATQIPVLFWIMTASSNRSIIMTVLHTDCMPSRQVTKERAQVLPPNKIRPITIPSNPN
jgi:hypothetical protein